MRTIRRTLIAVTMLLTLAIVCSADPIFRPAKPGAKTLVTLLPEPITLDGLQSAHGGGTAVEFERRSTFSFNAVKHGNGSVTGHLFYFFRDFDLDFKVRMDIDCMIIDGNRAKVSGIITQISANFPSEPWWLGARGSLQVEDNGNGNGAQPDRYSDFHFFEATCTDDNEPYIPIDGNIVVAP